MSDTSDTGEQRICIGRFDGHGADWDRSLEGMADASFCHLFGWREIMDGVLGQEPIYLVAREDGTGAPVGLLPLVGVRSRLFGNYLISMPFLNYGGPLGSDHVRGLLAEQAVQIARGRRVDLLELRSRKPLPGDLTISRRKVTVVLDLPREADELWKERFPAKLRSQVRRPTKAGMEVQLGSDQVAPFYEVFARNMRDLGTPVLPLRLFERIASVFGDRSVFGVVYRGEEPVAGGCGFVWGSEFELTWASALQKYSREAPNMLLYWAFMKAMIERGVGAFNFGRCTPGGGTHRFKLQWGGRDVQLPWAQWSTAGVAATPSPESPAYRLATRVWARLPLAVANRLGPPLARRIP